MQNISDQIVVDSGQLDPTFPAIYPTLGGFQLDNPAAWTRGQPFDLFRDMRERAPVMWSRSRRGRSRRNGLSGFWSITRYADIKQVELTPEVFSSQRGSMHLALPDRSQWKPR